MNFEYTIKSSSAVSSCHSKSALLVAVDLTRNLKLIKPGSYKPSSIVKKYNREVESKGVVCLRAP